MHFSSLHSSLKDESQDKDNNTKLWKDEQADPRTDVSPAVLDLQKKFAMMSKELKKSRGEYHEIATTVTNIQEESQAENSSHGEAGRGLDEDTFSIMMTSKVCSRGWLLGLVTFGFQTTLVVIMLIGYFKLSKYSTPFDAPIDVDKFVRVGQFFSVFLSVISQDDLLTLWLSFYHLHLRAAFISCLSTRTTMRCSESKDIVLLGLFELFSPTALRLSRVSPSSCVPSLLLFKVKFSFLY